MEYIYLVLTVSLGLVAAISFIIGIFNKPKMLELSMACALFAGLLFSFYNSKQKEKLPPLQYETEVVCGKFIRESNAGRPSYRAGGKGYTFYFNLEHYGFVMYQNINMGRKDISSATDYNKMILDSKVCLKIIKPVKQNIWNEDIKIIDYWENK
jgi:hypothetical protein